jgi:HEAT repeat protein
MQPRRRFHSFRSSGGRRFRADERPGRGILIPVLIGVLLSGTLIQAQSGSEPLDKIGKAFQAILDDLKQAEQDDLRMETLTKTLGRLEALLRRVRVEYGQYPDRHAERARVEFHLRFMVKWTRYLIQRSGGDPDESARDVGRAAAYRRGLELLGAAKQYENEHAEDRAGIVERYLEAFALVRGRKEEREILDRVNRIWEEVRGSEGTAGAKGGTARPVRDPPPAKPTAATPPGPKDGTPPEGKRQTPLTAEEIKQRRQDLLDGTSEARLAAAEALATLDQSWVGGFLVQRLAAEEDARVRKRMAEIVLEVGDRHIVRALGKWARFKEADRKREAIRLLGKIGGKEVEKTLVRFAKDKDVGTIRHLIKTAKALDNGHGVPTLARVAKNHPSLRFEVIEALGSTRDSSAARVVISFLHRRKFPEYKDPAIKALRVLGPLAIPPLIDALAGRDYRQWAAAALRSVTGQRFGMSPSRWRHWWSVNRQRLMGDDR